MCDFVQFRTVNKTYNTIQILPKFYSPKKFTLQTKIGIKCKHTWLVRLFQ